MARDKFTSSHINGSLRAWLPFLFYFLMAATLMLVDNRFRVGAVARAYTSEWVSPLWWLASRPRAIWQGSIDAANTNSQLRDQLTALEKSHLKSNLALQQTLAIQSENTELRKLLGAQRRMAPSARMVELININPEPIQKRFVINQGRRDGVAVGQVLIDAQGLVGQVTETYAGKSVVISITDADHAVPVMVARSGFRAIVIGQGKDNELLMANLTPSDDVRVGDVLLTSGVGGRFPAGIPVGVVKAFEQDTALTFLSARIIPFARLDYGRHLLLLDKVEAP